MTETVNKQPERHIKDYFEVLRRRRDIAVTFFVSTVLIVTIGSFLMTPIYRATVTLLVDPESPNVLTTTGMVALKSDNYLSYKEYFQSQKMIIESYSLAKKIFGDFKLGETKEYRGLRDPVKSFIKTIKVDPVPDTRLMKLSVENKNAQLAADMANHTAQLYVMKNLYYTSKGELSNLLKNEYLKLETRAAEYAKVYKEKHPEMIRLRTEMAEMAKTMNNEKMSIYDYNMIEDYFKKDSGRALAGIKANNVSIQDPAEKPMSPVRPKKLLNMFMSIVLGLLGGIGLAFFIEYLDDSVKTVEDIERGTQWPFLGSIPEINADGVLKESEVNIFVHLKPKDPISESYRLIRTRVLFMSNGDKPLKSVMVTSHGPQEGKTTTICNFSIAMAQSQKRVLLIDADMRKPRLYTVFGKENEKGLSEILSGQVQYKDAVKKTDIENLDLVTGGMIPPNPSELLAGKRMREFIASAKEDYDIVIVDTPPTGILTDAAIVAGLVDGVIMVVESGKTSKRVLARSYKLMADAKANIFGLVLNKSVIVPTDYYHYYSDAPRLPQDKTGEVLEFLKKELDKFLVKADKALKKAIEDYKNKRQLRRNRKAK